jgi:hypothetical protein
MRTKRIILGSICVVAGTLSSQWMYAASSGSGEFLDPNLSKMMAVAAGVVFLVFAASRWLFQSLAAHLILGCLGSYGSLLALVLVVSAGQGGLEETRMWMPVILIIGIPYMAPLVGMTWLGTVLIFPKRKLPEAGAQGDTLNHEPPLDR